MENEYNNRTKQLQIEESVWNMTLCRLVEFSDI
jgi:hypothetical protein